MEVIGVRFKTAGKVYFFDPCGIQVGKNSFVIVETARGTEFGEVASPNKIIDASQIVPPLRPVLRAASEADIAQNTENKQKEKDAFRICQEKIAEHGLEMKLVDVEYTFDRNKLLFYFTSEGRVDFRELVKHLASIFRTRIELRQIGIRDEAKLMGGLGICGRPLCCASFLSDFVQVSIKMAKEQSLSLNSSKISGVCGRLMCCLRYESEVYEEELRRSPAVDSLVRTPDGTGVVTEVNPLVGTVRVRFPENTPPPKLYPRDEVKVIGKAGKGGRPDEIHEDA
ncbi:MAG: stage 0 sporulation family protein [Clostridia bacterium]|nr:stage 0 sporulation family protein [Clostridia bacterium]